MGPQELERIAYNVECFLNALRMHDGRERTVVEEQLVKWLAGDAGKNGYAVYNLGTIYCHGEGGRLKKRFTLAGVKEGRTIWCDGRKISLLDTQGYEKGGKLVMLGAAGLILTMPGSGAAATSPARRERNSNNNNNNNNNNNG
jgi:hypothetical protein